MLYEAFSDFVEFKNTKEGKKLDKEKEELTLSFFKVKIKDKKEPIVRFLLNEDLVKSMTKNHLTTFKLLYHEKSYNVLLRYDNSSNAFTFEGKKLRVNGGHEFVDKYITAVMLDLMEEKNATRLIYKGKFLPDRLAYIFTLSKIVKEK